MVLCLKICSRGDWPHLWKAGFQSKALVRPGSSEELRRSAGRTWLCKENKALKKWSLELLLRFGSSQNEGEKKLNKYVWISEFTVVVENESQKRFLHEWNFLKANVPQCSEAYLLVETKTARWQKNENLMAFGDEAKSAAMANCGYFYIMANYRKNPETQISFQTRGDGSLFGRSPEAR